MFKDKTVLIIGGSGVFGSKLAQVLLQRFSEIGRIVIYSRHKQKQEETARLLLPNAKLKFYLGDVLHPKKLSRAMLGADYVVNAVEYEGGEQEGQAYDYLHHCLDGTQNIIEAAKQQKVAKVIHISSPAVCQPQSLQGLAQLAAERLIISANRPASPTGQETALAVLRYGKAINAHGGIIQGFRQLRDSGCLTLEDASATRYWFTLENGISWVFRGLALLKGGEIIVPHCPSVRLLDLAKAICPQCQLNIREGKEDYHIQEVLITAAEGAGVLEYQGYYLLQPAFAWWDREKYRLDSGGRQVAPEFKYSSSENNFYMTNEELQLMLKYK